MALWRVELVRRAYRTIIVEAEDRYQASEQAQAIVYERLEAGDIDWSGLDDPDVLDAYEVDAETARAIGAMDYFLTGEDLPDDED